MTGQLPSVAEFSPDSFPAWSMLCAVSPEAVGVGTLLLNRLKSDRAITFRIGDVAMPDREIALMCCIPYDVLERALPVLIMRRFMARDDEGALYCPELYRRELRRQENARKRAERLRKAELIQQRIEAGELPAGSTLQGEANKLNAMLAGKRVPGEPEEIWRLRRALKISNADWKKLPQSRKDELHRQYILPLLSAITGGKAIETDSGGQIQSGNGFENGLTSVTEEEDRIINSNLSSSQDTQPDTQSNSVSKNEMDLECINGVLRDRVKWDEETIATQQRYIRRSVRKYSVEIVLRGIETAIEDRKKSGEDLDAETFGAFKASIIRAATAKKHVGSNPSAPQQQSGAASLPGGMDQIPSDLPEARRAFAEDNAWYERNRIPLGSGIDTAFREYLEQKGRPAGLAGKGRPRPRPEVYARIYRDIAAADQAA